VITSSWHDQAHPVWQRIVRRLNVLARAHRIGHFRRARIRLACFDMGGDPRRLEDVGIDPQRHRRYDWLGETLRAMGGTVDRAR
jgi:hypothetical protein